MALEVTEESTFYSPTKTYYVHTPTRLGPFVGPRKSLVTKTKVSVEYENHHILAPVIVREMEEEFLMGSDLMGSLGIDVIKFYFENGVNHRHTFSPVSL